MKENPTANELLELFANKNVINNLRQKLCRQRSKINEKINLLDNKIYWISKVQVVYKGVPISYHNTYGHMWELVIPEGTIIRQANIYLNANNSKTWGCTLTCRDRYRISLDKDVWLGAGHTSFAKLKKMALEFVAKGIIPPEKDRKY